MIYKLYKNPDDTIADYVLRINDDGSQSCIPNCVDNSDWKSYQAWLADGNEPDPAE